MTSRSWRTNLDQPPVQAIGRACPLRTDTREASCALRDIPRRVGSAGSQRRSDRPVAYCRGASPPCGDLRPVCLDGNPRAWTPPVKISRNARLSIRAGLRLAIGRAAGPSRRASSCRRLHAVVYVVGGRMVFVSVSRSFVDVRLGDGRIYRDGRVVSLEEPPRAAIRFRNCIHSDLPTPCLRSSNRGRRFDDRRSAHRRDRPFPM
jgi:hypothetical protein